MLSIIITKKKITEEVVADAFGIEKEKPRINEASIITKSSFEISLKSMLILWKFFL